MAVVSVLPVKARMCVPGLTPDGCEYPSSLCVVSLVVQGVVECRTCVSLPVNALFPHGTLTGLQMGEKADMDLNLCTHTHTHTHTHTPVRNSVAKRTSIACTPARRREGGRGTGLLCGTSPATAYSLGWVLQGYCQRSVTPVTHT